MKPLLLLALMTLLGGCVSNTEENQFFYGGWAKPTRASDDVSWYLK